MYECKSCNEKSNYRDEVVFFNGDIIVEVSEQYPDWTHCLCVECFEKENTKKEISQLAEELKKDYIYTCLF